MIEEQNMLFYKYRPDVGINGRNLEILSKNEMYFASTSSFNDPFDCFPVPGYATDEQIIQVRDRMLSNTRIPESERRNAADKFAKNPQEMIAHIRRNAATPEYVRNFVSDYAIFCLSKNPKNRLLWSHYGGEHKGFAVEFNFAAMLESPPPDNLDIDDVSLFPIEVLYSRERPILEMNNHRETNIFITKDECWEYEDEYRVVITGKPRAVKYNPEYLSSIILGALASSELEGAITKAVDEFNQKHSAEVNVYKVELSDAYYDLHIPGHPVY